MSTAADGPDPTCELCGGTGWASYPDPFLDGALIDARCPACAEPRQAPSETEP